MNYYKLWFLIYFTSSFLFAYFNFAVTAIT